MKMKAEPIERSPRSFVRRLPIGAEVQAGAEMQAGAEVQAGATAVHGHGTTSE